MPKKNVSLLYDIRRFFLVLPLEESLLQRNVVHFLTSIAENDTQKVAKIVQKWSKQKYYQYLF